MMKSEILKILRKNGGYVSGQEMCEMLGVSRTAVWKAIKQLKEQGYMIEGIKNRGYRLLESPDAMDKDEIVSRLTTNWMGTPLFFAEETDSTNTWAKRIAEEGAPSGTVTVADIQSQGKGRRGRSWQTPKGTAVAMSVLVRPEILPEQASMLTIAAGLSVAQAVREETGLNAGIKWPNDVLISDRKICGILTEMSSQMTYVDYVICGLGINVNTQEFPDEIKKTATSLRLECGHAVKRALLIARVLKKFEINYEIFLKHGELSELMESYNELLIHKNKKIRVLEPQKEYEAISYGINHKGELLVEREDGTRASIYAGEVSVRGLGENAYV